MSAAQERRTGASPKEQGGAEHSQGMGEALQQGMFLLRFARAPRIGKKGQDENDQGPSFLGLIERLHDFHRIEQHRVQTSLGSVANLTPHLSN